MTTEQAKLLEDRAVRYAQLLDENIALRERAERAEAALKDERNARLIAQKELGTASWRWQARITELEQALAEARTKTIAICGGCECGIAYIPVPDSIDSGATFRCEAGHPIVFDVASPEQLASFYQRLATLEQDAARLDGLETVGRDYGVDLELVKTRGMWNVTYWTEPLDGYTGCISHEFKAPTLRAAIDAALARAAEKDRP